MFLVKMNFLLIQTQFLRYLQAKLHALADTHYETRQLNRRKNGGHPITPDKIEEIVARRKVCIPLLDTKSF